jgi:DNA-binding HxlR family transcriptional regulator
LAAVSRHRDRVFVKLNFSAYPVQASLGVLGRKWALLVLMNIALGQAQRFNELLRTTPGMSKRILAIRLSELERNGFIVRAEQTRGFTKWQLAPKGADVLPVLLTLIHFGSKWRSPAGAASGEPRPSNPTFDVTYLSGLPERTADRRRRSSDPGGSRT